MSYPSKVIESTKSKLYGLGKRVSQKNWQSKEAPDDTWEIVNHTIRFTATSSVDLLVKEVRPNLPWANIHFDERISGTPYNPPPSAKLWPFNPGSEDFQEDKKYSHTYPERLWPKRANLEESNTESNSGVRYKVGDLDDVISLLNRDPHTRQAFIPIWFPEDTGGDRFNQRVPCTLGYDLIMRDGFLHMNYYMRSCDAIRHLRDDIYLANRLLMYIVEKVNWPSVVVPGIFTMYIKSLHCFYSEKDILKQSNI